MLDCYPPMISIPNNLYQQNFRLRKFGGVRVDCFFINRRSIDGLFRSSDTTVCHLLSYICCHISVWRLHHHLHHIYTSSHHLTSSLHCSIDNNANDINDIFVSYNHWYYYSIISSIVIIIIITNYQ